MTTSSGWLSGHAYVIHWGVVQISLANLLVIVIMLVIFALALVLPFPGGEDAREAVPAERQADDDR